MKRSDLNLAFIILWNLSGPTDCI